MIRSRPLRPLPPIPPAPCPGISPVLMTLGPPSFPHPPLLTCQPPKGPRHPHLPKVQVLNPTSIFLTPYLFSPLFPPEVERISDTQSTAHPLFSPATPSPP